MTQTQQVIQYLNKYGWASSHQLEEALNIKCASNRIRDARKLGYNIFTVKNKRNANQCVYVRGADKYNNWVDPGLRILAEENGFAKEDLQDYVEESPGNDKSCHTFQLCWDCRKASTNGCSWSRKLVPVEGWTATPSERGSYAITECPEFIKD